MTPHVRLVVSASAAMPTLIVAMVFYTALAISGVMSWTVEVAVVLAVAAQALCTFLRLGRRAKGRWGERCPRRC